GSPEHRDPRRSRRSSGHRPRYGSADPRLPPEARRVRLRGRPRRGSGDWPGENGPTSRPRCAVTPSDVRAAIEGAAPHLLLGSVALGLTLPLWLHAPHLAWVVAPLLAVAAALDAGLARFVLLGVALLLAGWVWGSVRVDSLDASVLLRRVGDVRPAVVAVTGPVRRGRFSLRAPGEVMRWNGRRLTEAVELELPLGRSPPQGGLLRVTAEVRRARPRALIS